MLRRSSRVMKECIGFCGFLAAMAGSAWAAERTVHCADGDHIQIDVSQIAIQYDASSFAGTLSSLSVLGARLEVAPSKLQEAAAATQQWNELVKGLAEGYNGCAVTRQQYADGLNRIYPRLKEDAGELEAVRKLISDGQKTETKRLQSLLDSYWNNLRQFAQAGGQEIILQRIEALAQQVATGQGQILQKEDALLSGEKQILAKLNEIEQRNTQVHIPTPSEVVKEVSEVRKEPLAKADSAERAYNQGYALLNQYRFREAIPYLQQAVAAVPLPDFYFVLGRAYLELPDLSKAENIVREGLSTINGKNGDNHQADLDNLLAMILTDKGDLDGALSYALSALKIAEGLYGPNSSGAAMLANNIGVILKRKGDLDGALSYGQRALEIGEKVYGPDHPTVAIRANNISTILRHKGDLEGALSYAQRALKIDEKVYGLEDPNVASCANNIGLILRDKGDLDGALSYVQRALKIDERVYGSDHPNVARDANNIGLILRDKGDLDSALSYYQRALNIDEKVYGPDHSNVAPIVYTIGLILRDKGDLDGALSSLQRALKIDEKVYGPDHQNVAPIVANIGLILKHKGDLDGALAYLQRALKIDEKVYGPDHQDVAPIVGNIGRILVLKRDIDGAVFYIQRSLDIYSRSYGADNPRTREMATLLKLTKQAKEAKRH
jgi:tetratricopeptide (TPR) repeat protein